MTVPSLGMYFVVVAAVVGGMLSLSAVPWQRHRNFATSIAGRYAAARFGFFPLLILLVAFQPGRAQPLPPTAPAAPALSAGSADRGRSLFAGRVRFRNGGPPCASCHSVAGLSFPGGGVLGPDLTGEYSRLGPDGLQIAMQTLFFPTMAPIYDRRPLSPDEQADLIALFQHTDGHAVSTRNTVIFLGLGLAVCIALLLVAGHLWRNRLTSTRGRLVMRARWVGGAA